MKYQLIPKFCADTGYTEKAVRRKIQDGIWLEGRQFLRAPDGHIMIIIEGVENWVEGQRATSSPSRRRSASGSPGTASVR
jgi:hypothetical protein